MRLKRSLSNLTLLIIAVLLTVPVLALAATDDHGNDYTTATVITVGIPVDADLEVNGDNDYFSFSATAGTVYHILDIGLGLDDPELELYDTDGTSLLVYDDDGGSFVDSSIIWVCPGSGIYYINAYGWGEAGTYTLSVDTFLNDHGNDYTTATVVTVGTPVDGDIEAVGVHDWFRFSATTGASYNILAALISLTDSELELYDTDGTTLLAYNDDWGADNGSSITWTCPVSGTYYVDITGYMGQNTGTYTFSVANMAAPTDPDVDDDGDGFTGNSGDCNDNDATIYQTATEVADDGIDNNCNGYDLVTYYDDADLDGYGDPADSQQAETGTAPAGYVKDNNDCDDTDAAINPAATEIADDGIDQDCSGSDLTNATSGSGGGGGCFIATASYQKKTPTIMDYIIDSLRNVLRKR